MHPIRYDNAADIAENAVQGRLAFCPKEAPLWVALYQNMRGGCWNVEIGHKKGPPIKQETALVLARKYLKDHPKQLEGYYFTLLAVGSRRQNNL